MRTANARRERPSAHPPRAGRRAGMTLIELLLVLALMVLLAGMAVLSFQGTFSYRALLAGGDALRGEIAACRNLAMSTGTIQVMTVTPGSTQIVTVPFGSRGGATLVDAVAASAGDAADGSYRVRTFPDKVQFLGGIVAADARDLFVQQGATASAAATSRQPGGSGSPTEVYFYPDGVTSDAALYLQDDNGDVILVTLRGLTGMTTIREVSRAAQP